MSSDGQPLVLPFPKMTFMQIELGIFLHLRDTLTKQLLLMLKKRYGAASPYGSTGVRDVGFGKTGGGHPGCFQSRD